MTDPIVIKLRASFTRAKLIRLHKRIYARKCDAYGVSHFDRRTFRYLYPAADLLMTQIREAARI